MLMSEQIGDPMPCRISLTNISKQSTSLVEVLPYTQTPLLFQICFERDDASGNNKTMH